MPNDAIRPDTLDQLRDHAAALQRALDEHGTLTAWEIGHALTLGLHAATSRVREHQESLAQAERIRKLDRENRELGRRRAHLEGALCGLGDALRERRDGLADVVARAIEGDTCPEVRGCPERPPCSANCRRQIGVVGRGRVTDATARGEAMLARERKMGRSA